MNLFSSDLRYISEVVQHRTKKRGGTWLVFVRMDGVVQLEKVGEERRKQPLPDSDLVGGYNRSASLADIEADLSERLREIAA